MKLLLVALFLAPACTGFLARVRDHFEKKFKKPECHLEWEDVVTPHCETKHEQVRISFSFIEILVGATSYASRCAWRSTRISARLSTAPPARLNTTRR